MEAIKRQAAEDFSRARTREVLTRIMHFMNPGRDNLLSLEDVRNILKPQGESYKGMRVVPIKLIVGSEGRYRDFNKYFLPRRDYLRLRWEKVDQARLSDITLPPIQLYEIGGVYFVRDGNHRVSVAKTQGTEQIDAEVTSLSTEVRISPQMTIGELKAALLAYEKRVFYEKTNFKELTGQGDLDFTNPGRYDLIYQHILDHKYYLNLSQAGELPFSQALVSWYSGVYQPIVNIINEENLTGLFPQRTPSDLYVWIVKYWDLLKKKYGLHYALSDAVRDFSSRYGGVRVTPLRLIKSLWTAIFGKGRNSP
ncbi:MAG: transcriptional regulator [Treponema sp.]|jgi:hypothetical protein|nr:transcriptional regulator [Treponema sp.]